MSVRLVLRGSPEYREKNTLHLWVVYDHPRDCPDDFVAREHVVLDAAHYPTDNALKCRDVDLLRRHMESMGLARIERAPDDDPCIIESWL